MFDAVRHRKAPQQIVHQIRNAILEGRLTPGDKIASDRELMEQFNVSRQTLREALRALEYLGLIEIRKGVTGGAYVAEVDMDITRDSLVNFLHFKNLSVHHLSEIRKIIEPYAARVAAASICEEDLARLREIHQTCKEISADGYSGELTRHEIRFHRIIANTTGNPILILMLDFVENLLEDAKKVLKPDQAFSDAVIHAHERILEAIVAHDPERASAEMRRHVVEVEEGLSQLEKGKPVLWTAASATNL